MFDAKTVIETWKADPDRCPGAAAISGQNERHWRAMDDENKREAFAEALEDGDFFERGGFFFDEDDPQPFLRWVYSSVETFRDGAVARSLAGATTVSEFEALMEAEGRLADHTVDGEVSLQTWRESQGRE